MSNTMLSSMTESHLRVRSYLNDKFAAEKPDALYTFDLDECIDASLAESGVLLEQDQDFWLFELNIERGRRAGPSVVSPRRYRGELDLAFFTKKPRDQVKYTGMLEAVADWLQDQTINGIRFRTFNPTSPVDIHGFTSYNGVIVFEFDIYLTR
jgi:hypothetical protein